MEGWFLIRLCMALAVILATALLAALDQMTHRTMDKFKAKGKVRER